ncbi:MAG TPA: alanine racemase [Gemmatimonadaceae bacterium]|jgi:alanine racemase
MHSLNRRAWVEIDLGALLRNASKLAASAQVPLLPMVKADAYGIGAVRVARTLEQLDPWGYGVATIAEGEQLRRSTITRPILVFTPLLPGDFDNAIRAGLTPTLGDAESIVRWQETERPWHLDIDTGMSRAGVKWDRLGDLRDIISRSPPEGVFTHFHSAELKNGSYQVQERRFDDAVASLPVRPRYVHAENSPAIQHYGASKWSFIRPGVFLYGVTSGADPRILPEQVVSVRARVVELRTIGDGETVSYDGTYKAKGDRCIATLAIGYADGYRRAFGNHASAVVRGVRVPVVGLVTMDMTMLDVTGVDCQVGDPATLVGVDGDDRIDIMELAAWGEMSAYELLTGLRARLARRYIRKS